MANITISLDDDTMRGLHIEANERGRSAEDLAAAAVSEAVLAARRDKPNLAIAYFLCLTTPTREQLETAEKEYPRD